jgi:hypothetical protein
MHKARVSTRELFLAGFSFGNYQPFPSFLFRHRTLIGLRVQAWRYEYANVKADVFGRLTIVPAPTEVKGVTGCECCFNHTPPLAGRA